MSRNYLTAISIAVMLGTGMASDYCFPSPVNPAGKDPSQVKQYISIIWDDNGYSGLDGTVYEADTGSIEKDKKWSEKSFVGGKFPWGGTAPNKLNINEKEIGMSWAISLDVPMTFNPISGLFLPVWGPDWDDRESKLGYYVDPVASPDHKRIAVAWGREYNVEKPKGTWVEGGQIDEVFKDALAKGHEIGNHTIDHMESNSPVPGGDSPNAALGFGRWDNEGYDEFELDTMTWKDPKTGEIVVLNETEEMGTKAGSAALTMGWKMYSGKSISSNAWKGAIELGEEQLNEYLDISVQNGKVSGFRAPRLEVNSELFFALEELGYEYDCGLEEGYEEHRDGSNFLWPYTTDNGSRNAWTQYSLGEMRFVDSMPSGLWEIPVNAIVVPTEIRDRVWENHKEVMIAEGETPTDEDKSHWTQNSGKITSFDFNTWILWGMEKDTWIESMKHTTQLRLNGNKAPFHYGAHTQYYTPMYDNANLLTEWNIKTYGLCVTKGWNDFKVRIEATEEWINWAKQKDCEFVTGHELISKIKTLQEEAGAPEKEYPSNVDWKFYRNENLSNKSIGDQKLESGSGTNIEVTIAAPEDDEYPYCAYSAGLTAQNISHISLDYMIKSGALAIRLQFSDDEPSREVILTNSNGKEWISSGKIPIHAFDYNEYADKEKIDYSKPIDFSKLVSIEIQPLAPMNGHDGTYSTREEPFEMSFSISKFKVYGKEVEWYDGTSVMGDLPSKNSFSLRQLPNNMIGINVTNTKEYTISITNVKGQEVQEVNSIKLSTGINKIPLKDMSKGIYLLQLSSLDKTFNYTKKLVIR